MFQANWYECLLNFGYNCVFFSAWPFKGSKFCVQSSVAFEKFPLVVCMEGTEVPLKIWSLKMLKWCRTYKAYIPAVNTPSRGQPMHSQNMLHLLFLLGFFFVCLLFFLVLLVHLQEKHKNTAIAFSFNSVFKGPVFIFNFAEYLFPPILRVNTGNTSQTVTCKYPVPRSLFHRCVWMSPFSHTQLRAYKWKCWRSRRSGSQKRGFPPQLRQEVDHTLTKCVFHCYERKPVFFLSSF